MQGMISSASDGLTGATSAVDSDPIVARAGGVRLRWHARTLRGERSIAQAARLVGLNRDELGRIERGETTQIRFETVAKLLAGYRCELAELVEIEADTDELAQRPAPLYAGVLAALAHGTLERRPPGRRATRRDASLDIVAAGDEAAFARADLVSSAHRRRPVGTLNRPGQ